ncbi:VF530 family DNA-binding protein [Luteolibacter sp. AS25]|uniref:VF530 family protein n=1 Tax=Luteolibacter sp. AS25 TaxID=3135776 RepID=UPI00398A9D08
MNSHPNDPLHGYTLEIIITRLVEEYGWDELADRIRIRCFANDPSVKSTLKFLRKTPWARNKVENLFIETLERHEKEFNSPDEV